jgi:hypothetical protein
VDLFLNGSNHRDSGLGEAAGCSRCRGYERCQGTFGIDRSSSIQSIPAPPHGDQTGDRVDMPQQYDISLYLGISQSADDVACFIPVCAKTQGCHMFDQVLGYGVLVTGWARYREYLLQKCE